MPAQGPAVFGPRAPGDALRPPCGLEITQGGAVASTARRVAHHRHCDDLPLDDEAEVIGAICTLPGCGQNFHPASSGSIDTVRRSATKTVTLTGDSLGPARRPVRFDRAPEGCSNFPETGATLRRSRPN
jgi:hypothetical protein